MKASNKPYILYIGNNYPHKNLKRLKLAFNKLNLDYELRLITDFVSEEKLDELYKNASLYVQPSLIEGFGLTPLEAMKRGTPVACSNAGALPEILENSTIYFNPLNINDIAKKMHKVLLDNKTKKALIQKGYEQIKKYSWRKMAKETLEVYKEIFTR